jgi:DNA-binding transcriptional ArsR family regulator
MSAKKLDILRRKLQKIPKPCCLADVVRASGLSEPTVSKHVQVLAAAGEIQVKSIGNLVVIL